MTSLISKAFPLGSSGVASSYCSGENGAASRIFVSWRSKV